MFPCAGPVPDGPHPTVLPWGSASLSPAGRGVKILVSAAGLLRCGRRTGKSPGGEAAEPESQSWRSEEGQGTSGLCAPPAPSANSPASGMESGSLGGPRSELGLGIRKEAFKSGQDVQKRQLKVEGRSQVHRCPLGRRNAKALQTRKLCCLTEEMG